MSHFTVLVIGNDIDSQLAPYAENDVDEQYSVFDNKEEEFRKEYEKDTIDVVEVDGHLYSLYDDRFHDGSKLYNDKKYPVNAVFKKVTMKEFYTDFEEFLSDYHGLKSPDEKTGLYGYWSNPNAKWDWYTIGGRWSGYFKIKSGSAGSLGQPGVFDNKPEEVWVDQLSYGDIDFDGMKSQYSRKANERYDQFEAIVQGRDIPSWTRICEKHVDNIEAARYEYNNNPVIKDLDESKFHYFSIDLEYEYGLGRESYVKKCTNRTAVPYAVLKDGKWYQKGEMGWFGMSNDDMLQDEWNDEFWKLLATLDDDTLLTLVDCHT